MGTSHDSASSPSGCTTRGTGTVKAALDGRTCLRLSHAISRARAARVTQKIAHNSRHSTLPIPTIVVLKSYDIFCDINDSRKQVVGLIYTKQFVPLACRRLVACDKVVPCKLPFSSIPSSCCCALQNPRVKTLDPEQYSTSSRPPFSLVPIYCSSHCFLDP